MFPRWIFGSLLLSIAPLRGAEAGKLESKPSTVAIAFAEALRVADMPRLRELVTQESVAELKKMPGRPKEANPPELVEEKIEGDRATVSLRIPVPGRKNAQPEAIPLARVDGEWRVDLVAFLKELRPKVARSMVSQLHNLLIFRQARTKSLPSTEQGLSVLTQAPQDSPFPEERRPMMEKIPLDPWGNPYRYEFPAKWNKGEKFDVFSAGPDQQAYTEDDIGNWDFGWPPPDKKPVEK